MDKVKNLGQVFTPVDVVKLMFELSQEDGNILEPSAGDGAFTFFIKKVSDRDLTSIEIDVDRKNDDFITMDFFDYSEDFKFNTIIGNPPYVGFKNISNESFLKIKQKPYFKDYDNRTNLYIYFIRKCVEHLKDNGEIIFITPREFIKATSSIPLNNFLYETGDITHWYEYGDEVVFPGYSPTVVIWRYKKDSFNRTTKTKDGDRIFHLNDGQISFVSETNELRFKDLFFVKVGAVSGMDEIFINENGNESFVCSSTKKNGELRKMFYNIEHDYLLPFKDKLINRKIKNFNESNWWQWGRGLYKSDSNRIYVNCKTRDNTPFFTNDCKYYDGSVLAIFPKSEIDIQKAIQYLNNIDWYELGFKVGGRYCFTQKSLENIQLPDHFMDLLNDNQTI